MTTSHTLASLLLAQAEPQSPLGGLPFILLIVGVFYFLMIRPQQRKARMHQDLVGSVKQGDRVVAAGGLVGTIRRIDDDIISLQVADNVVLKVDRASVARRLDS